MTGYAGRNAAVQYVYCCGGDGTQCIFKGNVKKRHPPVEGQIQGSRRLSELTALSIPGRHVAALMQGNGVSWLQAG